MNTGTSVSNQPDFRVDFDKLMENLKELSILAGDGISKIQHTTDGARLKVYMLDLINHKLYPIICNMVVHN